MSMTILYELGDNLYVNLTNRCNCRCVFCLRNNSDHVQDTDSLWLEHEPTVEEVLEEAKKFDFSQYREIVFCGYGEPTLRLDDLLTIAETWKQESPSLIIRINTNGLSDLQYQTDTAKKMAGIIDKVSISLNASEKKHYFELTRSSFGVDSFDGLLTFARHCREYGISVRFSIVDLLPEQEIRECKAISEKLSVPLEIRIYEPKE
ncbi:TIGR04100 family radical SAM protein [Massiliimalia timonensis]|uniref:TIGR04100 family radical SAM protein n=1 Tax=Massiliimalia timonensis TaxID=1987501 RepID=UPI001E46626E|nr:TIGR04100 family radical SAM protein [Massiliimalia timonensis]